MSAAVNAFRKHATQWVMQRAVAPTRTAVRRMGGGHDDHHAHARRRVPESPPPASRARSSPRRTFRPPRALAPRARPPPRPPDGENRRGPSTARCSTRRRSASASWPRSSAARASSVSRRSSRTRSTDSSSKRRTAVRRVPARRHSLLKCPYSSVFVFLSRASPRRLGEPWPTARRRESGCDPLGRGGICQVPEARLLFRETLRQQCVQHWPLSLHRWCASVLDARDCSAMQP